MTEKTFTAATMKVKLTSKQTLSAKLKADARMTAKMDLMYKGDKGDKGDTGDTGETIASAYCNPDGTMVLTMDSGRRVATNLQPLTDSIGYAESAKESAAAAAASQQAASGSESAAASSASSSASSALAAKTSETNAKASETKAAVSESAAASSASAAASSASAASSSQSAAKTSETNAKTSETNAAASASAAAASARTQQADWTETDSTFQSFIKNKPTNLLTTNTTQTITADKTFAGAVTMATVNTTSLTVTGSTSVPTANADNNSNTVANTAFVKTAIANLVNGAPSQLDTLQELSAALGNDANFSAAVANEIGEKVSKSGDTITGPILYDKTPNDDTELPNKAYVDAAIKSAVDKSATEADTKISTAHNYIKRNTAYKVGDILESPNLPRGYLIVVTQAGTTGSSEPNWTTIKNSLGGVVSDGTVQFYINDTLSKHALGDIVYKPLEKVTEHEYLLPLDGQTIDNTTYKRLVDYLGTTTLPNLNGRYLRADSTPNTMVAAGLPNIEGWANVAFSSDDTSLSGDVDTKLFSSVWKVSGTQEGTSRTVGNLTFNAQNYNSIYGNSNTVTPLTYTVRAYICYA